LLPYVDRIFAELKNGELAAREFSTSRRGTIRLGTGATQLIYLLPKALTEFRRKFPLIEVLVTTEVTEVVLQQLLAQTVDLGIIMSPAEALKSVDALPLCQEELVIIMSAEHPLANRSVLAAQDLSGLPFISHLRGIALHTVQQNYFDQLGVQPPIIMELENIEAIKSLVRAGMGVSMVPDCTTMGYHGHGIVAKRIRNFPMSRQLLIAAKDWRSHPPATLRLARSIIQKLGGREALRAAAAKIDVLNDLH
jgi:LysR family transcriptional activator of glutamate synthase operon